MYDKPTYVENQYIRIVAEHVEFKPVFKRDDEAGAEKAAMVAEDTEAETVF